MRIRIYQLTVVVITSGVLLAVVPLEMPDSWTLVILLALLRFIVETFAFSLPLIGSGSLAFSVIFASVLLFGPGAGALVAAAGAVTRQDIEQGKSSMTMLFNVAQLALMGAVGGTVFIALGQSPMMRSDNLLPVADANWFVAVVITALVMAGLNIGLVGYAISLIREMPLARVLRESFQDYLLSMLALALLGMILAELIATTNAFIGILLIVIPFAVAWQTFQVYTQQSEAYRSTVRCLVTAIEAKDPYTRGHSERVAWYALQIAKALGLQDDDRQRIEWAALLHDVGKVAVSRRTLTKAGKLDNDEVAAIREHPEIAATILSEIDFLSDAVPYVLAHHERLDGNGYPHGKLQTELPIGARILAVADCFDAMTSQRAYRHALSYPDAARELRLAAGSQLDAECVEVLLESVDSTMLARILTEEATGIVD